MAVTASRLGGAPLTLDWSNLASVASGEGPRARAHTPHAEELISTWKKLQERFQSGEVGFFDAPVQESISALEETRALTESLLASGGFTDCLFLGIGGSALGPISMLSALKDRCRGKLQFHFMENPDPADWRFTLGGLKPESTLVCVVTKSGGTFETLAQFMLALEWLGKGRWKSNILAITDPTKGELRQFVQQHGIKSLPVHPSLGGRFSIFSPVGFFAAIASGLDVKAFLQGASKVRDFCLKTAPEKNALFALASHLIAHYPQRRIHVCMPYTTELKVFSSWWVQLWGESLGKDGRGFTPLAAVGATDQHSLLQLLRDGPDDKVTGFITVGDWQDPVKIPVMDIKDLGGDYLKFPTFNLLQNHSLQRLLEVEYQATSVVLTKKRYPNFVLQMDKLDETSMGALYFAFCVLTAFAGTLWEVNPFDQPGVEEGKVYIRESLGRLRRASQDAEDDPNSPVARLRMHSQD